MWLVLGSDDGKPGTFHWECKCGSRQVDFYCYGQLEAGTFTLVAFCLSCMMEQWSKLPMCGGPSGRNL